MQVMKADRLARLQNQLEDLGGLGHNSPMKARPLPGKAADAPPPRCDQRTL